MKRIKKLSKDAIINMARHIESGDRFFKIDNGSVTKALIEARYYLEFGMSSEEYKEKCYKEANDFMARLSTTYSF